MPELPDLSVFAENLHRRLCGRQATAIEIEGGRLDAGGQELQAAVAGALVDRVQRAGKEIDFHFRGPATLRIHLMLAGRFHLTDTPARLRDRMLTLRFAAGPALVVTDPKRLVRIALNPPADAAPDALAAEATYLRQKAAAKPKTLAKAFLIDQAVLRGIGNAYADEILWRAGISPKAAVGRIPAEGMDALAGAIPEVLTAAMEKIRAAEPDIIGGELRDFLLIHNPQRAESPTGHIIRKEKVASKTTYFTDEQVEY